MSECVAARYGPQQAPVPATRREDAAYYYVTFEPSSSFIDCGSDASLDNLAAGSFTIDFWFRSDFSTGGTYEIIGKETAPGGVGEGWTIETTSASKRLEGDLYGATSAAVTETTSNTLVANVWAHVTFVYDSVADLIYFAKDGVWCAYAVQYNFGVPYDGDDSTAQFYMGRWGANINLDGDIQWLRVSSGIRYPVGVDFVPPVMCAPPAVDGTTVELWAMDEGAGALTAASVVAASDGVMTDCTWGLCT